MKNIYLLISLFLLVGSCQKEDIHREIDNLSLKDSFNPDHFMDVVPYTFTVDWNGGSEVSLYGFDSIAVEYPIIYTAALTPEILNIKSDLSFKLMVIAHKETPEFYINKYVNLDKSDSDDLSQFTGNIQTFDEHGETLASRWYEKGIFLSDLKNPSATPDSGLSQNKMPLERSYIVLRTFYVTEWYTEDGGGGWRKTHSTNHGYTEEVIWNQDDYYVYGYWDRSGNVDKSGGGGNGPYGTTYTGIASREEATIKKIEDRRGYEIIINELTGKEKCLYDLLTKNGTDFVKDLLTNFEGESEFDIKIMSKDKVVYTDKDGKKKEVNGKTIYELNSKFINIEISTSKLNALPALGAVRTILHEFIHADMFRKLYTHSPTQKDLDFKTTYENFKSERGHEAMALLYVNSMKEALKEFHKKVMINDYNFLTDNGANPLPDSFYEGLAWQGLKEHSVQAYRDLKDDRKTEMENSISLYYHNTTKSCPKK